MLAEIAAGLTSLNAAKTILQGLNATNTQVEINDAKIGLQDQIFAAQQALFAAQQNEAALAQRIGELEQQIVNFEDWEAEKQRYELKEYYPGTLAYALKPSMANGEPEHRICTPCYQQRKKSILQATGKTTLGYREHICPSCKSVFAMSPKPKQASDYPTPDPATAPASPDDEDDWVSARGR